jgi:hypothetical protein
MDGWKDGQIDGWMDGWMESWMVGRKDGVWDGWKDGWIENKLSGCNVLIICYKYASVKVRHKIGYKITCVKFTSQTLG